MGSHKSRQWQLEQQTLKVLASLSYRTGELSRYLREISLGVSQLIEVDWSVVTLCQQEFEKVLASSIDMGEGDHTYSLHGLLTATVVQRGCSLVVEDAKTCTEYGKAPEGYRSYLGVPLRTADGHVIGTICSFHRQPRKFSPEEVQIAELFAERAATAIDNYRLYQQQLKFNETLEAEVARRTQELREAQAKLLEQARLAAIGEFAATIVHEIRNPLTTVTMGLRYFKRVDLSEAGQERLELALGEAERLQRLLSEILLYAKPQTLQLSQLNLNQMITQMLDSLQNLPEAQGRTIEFAPAPTVPLVMGDQDKLKQVFINLIRNACEAVAPGETICWQVDTDIDSGTVWTQVHNGGQPIPPDILPQLTQPFVSTKSSGTGLGLAIVKRIVEAHKGELSIQSSAEEGTTVTVRLPKGNSLATKFLE